MTFDLLQAKLVRLMSFPVKSQIKIDFDQDKKFVQLSSIIYRSGREVPLSVRKYVEARFGMTFKPHKSFFLLENDTVKLVQEIPFELGFQKTLREESHAFWRMAKGCSQMLLEIAAEESLAAYQNDNIPER